MTFGSFFERIDELESRVGTGMLEGKVEVDQIYAGYQEFREDLRHPRGGQAHALRDSLYDTVDKHMTRLAAEAHTDLRAGMRDVVEGISDEYFRRAPRLVGDLESSGHPTVTDNGEVVYDRSPNTHRLSESELRAKARTVREFQDLFGPGIEK